jgi:hypothetical protein
MPKSTPTPDAPTIPNLKNLMIKSFMAIAAGRKTTQRRVMVDAADKKVGGKIAAPAYFP